MFAAWREFRRGKSKKEDVGGFEFDLEDNLFEIQESLLARTYKHGAYQEFYVRDPKLRHIHKAEVRDRVVHQALFRVLYQIFDKKLIHDSYSCRAGKGTHRAVRRLAVFARKLSQNHNCVVFVLKCDIRKFFDSIDHRILTDSIARKIKDKDALRLISEILCSFEKYPNRGLPLGNVTSQLFGNVYLHELDRFVKHKLRIRYYIRYCDDFVVLGKSIAELEKIIGEIRDFLLEKLLLELHEEKIVIRKFSQGIDFLGYVVFPHYCALRTRTKSRILRAFSKRKRELAAGKIGEEKFYSIAQSYLGILHHCEGHKIRKKLLEEI